mmetsp:Transcript_44567/g.104745  ORF Transcript_44567/g.104745 Transcript_44567/m.104745 type:complete len:245 (-) Transcript_44567:258-992(-)
MDQGRRTGFVQQRAAGVGVEVAGHQLRGLRGAALGARLPSEGLALGQRPGKEVGLPRGRMAGGAPGLVGGVGQALGVAVGEQPALAEGVENAGVGQGGQPGVLQQRAADQEVAVAGHEENLEPVAGLPQHRDGVRFEGLVAGVIAHPDLEDVTEQQHRLGGRLGQMACQPGLGGRRVGAQMQVGQQVDLRPACRGREAVDQTSTAFSMTTSSTGTSPWPPRPAVLTFSILSTTSWPWTTLPNTA